MKRLLSFLAAPVLAASVIAAAGPALAQQKKTPIRFTLDWKYQGVHAFVFWAEDKGYFAAEGLDVTVDQGSGSSATVSKIASGTYDAGFGDMNAIVQLAAAKPGEQPVMVYMVYNRPPFAIIAKASSPIKTLADLQGRTLGAPAGSAAGQLFPPLAKRNGVDAGKVTITSIAPNLQEQMMLTGQVDASAVFSVTSYVNLVGQKIDPDKDIRWFFYSDYGVDLYSNGVMVSKKLIRENPKAVAGLVRALSRAMIESAADPDAAIAMTVKREPLLDAKLEKQRLIYALKTHVATPEAAEIGVGDIKPERMKGAVDLLVETYGLPATPAVGDVFDRSFLPPKAERIIKLPM